MPSVCSAVDSINRIHFKELKSGKLLKNCEVIRIAGCTIIKDNDGSIYCDKLKNYAYGISNWPWLNPLLRGLVRLKVIPKADQLEHEARAKKEEARINRRGASRELKKLAENHGFKLTSEMEKFIKDNPPSRW